jgi:hypothetical protein
MPGYFANAFGVARKPSVFPSGVVLGNWAMEDEISKRYGASFEITLNVSEDVIV